MAIWIGRYLAGEPLDDGYVLYKGWGETFDDVYAVPIVPVPCFDDPDAVCETFGGPTVRYTGDVPLPPEHPDDIAADERIMASMPPPAPDTPQTTG